MQLFVIDVLNSCLYYCIALDGMYHPLFVTDTNGKLLEVDAERKRSPFDPNKHYGWHITGTVDSFPVPGKRYVIAA